MVVLFERFVGIFEPISSVVLVVIASGVTFFLIAGLKHLKLHPHHHLDHMTKKD